jgi:hydrogenase expression/formation protein HypC
MCLTAPVRVISIDGGVATVDAGGLRRSASTLVVPEVRPGDWALMTAGTLVRVLDPAVAAELAAAVRTATGEIT